MVNYNMLCSVDANQRKHKNAAATVCDNNAKL